MSEGPETDAATPARIPGLAGRRVRIAGVVISVLSVAGVAIWALSQPAPDLPSDAAGWLAFAAAIAAYALATGARSERWLSLLRRDGIPSRRSDAWGLTVVGFMGNNILPARGGDFLSAYLMSNRTQTRFRFTLASLIAVRVLDLATIIVLYLVVANWLLAGIDLPGDSLLGLEIAIGAVVVFAGAGLLLAIRRGKLPAVGRVAAQLLGTTRRLWSVHGLAMLALSFLIWAAEAITLLLCAEAVGFHISVLESLGLIGIAGVLVLVPSGPGYAGTLDAALLFGAGAIGAPPELALSFLLIARFVVFVPITVAGLILMVAVYGWDSFGLRRNAEQATARG